MPHFVFLLLVFHRFVLTYIPDLKWCHLAPMYQDGVFGPERKRSNGRPRWRLVDENLGKELDLSSMYCIPVRSKALKKTADADKEEWDILDGTPAGAGKPDLKSKDVLHDAGSSGPRRTIRKQPMRARSAIKPLGGKLAVLQPIDPEPVSNGSLPEIRSPLVCSGPQPLSPLRRPHCFTPTSSRKRTRSTPSRISPRWTPKGSENDDMAPLRKARKLSNAGARRCALQH